MGFKALTWAMSLDLPDTKCFAVLAAMASYADENGVCWPSQSTIANKTKLARETVSRTIKKLRQEGYISGQGKAYLLNLNVTEDHTIVTQDHIIGGEECDSGSHQCDSGSQGCDSGSHPSEPVNNQSMNKSGKKPTKKNQGNRVEKPSEISDQVWRDFLSHRKSKKAPLTETALRGIESQANKAGWKLEDALAEICSRGWQGFNADWVEKKKSRGSKSAVSIEEMEKLYV